METKQLGLHIYIYTHPCWAHDWYKEDFRTPAPIMRGLKKAYESHAVLIFKCDLNLNPKP